MVFGGSTKVTLFLMIYSNNFRDRIVAFISKVDTPTVCVIIERLIVTAETVESVTRFDYFWLET